MVSLDYRHGKELHSGNSAGLVFEIMNLTNISIFNNLLPPTESQAPQFPKHGTITNRIFDGRTAVRDPTLWH